MKSPIQAKIREKDLKAYNLAKKFLLRLKISGVTESLIQKYLNASASKARFKKIEDIYGNLLFSAQNANMKAGVIGRSMEGGIDNLGKVLFNFNPELVLKKYQNDWNYLLDDIKKKVKPNGKIRRSSRSIWPQYCRTILSAADFITQFATADEFYKWVDSFDSDYRKRPALPMILSYEIEGFGFALGCDFLKDLGYINFGKPDVHIRDIFEALKLCSKNADDYLLFKTIVRIAQNVGKSPYEVDKLFWLIGSGYFYDDPHIGNEGRTGRHKAPFIRYAKKYL
ncbi:MAG: hypothetical protein Q8N37_04490 [bacterium]|nr:hypothetical protein [bacterium]